MQGFWTSERVEILTAKWTAGVSASTIARQIGNGISRNAVISKAHRLGISTPSASNGGAAATARAGSRWNPPRNPKGTKQGPQPIDFKLIETEPEPMGEWRGAQVRGRCDWIHGHPNSGEDWRRCGHPVAPERLYCGYHYAKTIQQKHAPGERRVSKDWLDANAQRQFQKVALG